MVFSARILFSMNLIVAKVPQKLKRVIKDRMRFLGLDPDSQEQCEYFASFGLVALCYWAEAVQKGHVMAIIENKKGYREMLFPKRFRLGKNLKQAREAKAVALRRYGCTGIAVGITKFDGGYALSIKVSSPEISLGRFPAQIKGVPVSALRVGKIMAQKL